MGFRSVGKSSLAIQFVQVTRLIFFSQLFLEDPLFRASL